MDTRITKLDEAIRGNYPDYYDVLGPGSSAEDLDELERVFGQPLPPLYRDFLAWRGPTPKSAPREAGSLIFNQDLMTAREAIDTVSGMRELREADPSWITSVWWGEFYLPILDNHCGDFICIDVNGEALLKETRWDDEARSRVDAGTWASIPGQIIDFTHDAEFREIQAPDFGSWLEAITTNFANGSFVLGHDTYSGTPFVHFEDTDDYTDRNDLMEAAFRARNPGYPQKLEQQFWTD